EILQFQRLLAGMPASEHIFPGRNGPLGESAFEHLLKKLGHGDITLHGFRSSFRDCAAEQTAFAHDVVEQALAHSVRTAVERAYKRTDLFERRRKLMEMWADFLARPVAEGATVTKLRA